MCRDEDIVFAILLILERAEGPVDDQHILRQLEVSESDKFSREGLSRASVAHHVSILDDAGFIKLHYPRGSFREITRLTWSGHEYLDLQMKRYGKSIL